TVQATVALADNDAFEGLQTRTITFLHFDLDDNGVARCEGRDFLAHLLGFDRLDDLVGHCCAPKDGQSARHRYVNYRPAGEGIPPTASSLLQKASGYPEDRHVVLQCAQGLAAGASAGCVRGCR